MYRGGRYEVAGYKAVEYKDNDEYQMAELFKVYIPLSNFIYQLLTPASLVYTRRTNSGRFPPFLGAEDVHEGLYQK